MENKLYHGISRPAFTERSFFPSIPCGKGSGSVVETGSLVQDRMERAARKQAVVLRIVM